MYKAFVEIVCLQQETSRRAKTSKLMEILPHRGPSCFPKFVNKLRRDYSWVAIKLETEFKKAQKEIPKDIKKKLIDVYNNQLCPLVYVGKDHSNILPPETHPHHLVKQLSESVRTLKINTYDVLGKIARDPPTTDIPLPSLIDQRFQSFLNGMKRNKTNVNVEQKYGKEVTKIKKELDKQKQAFKQLQSSLQGKKKKIHSLSCDNLPLLIQSHQLEVTTIQKELIKQKEANKKILKENNKKIQSLSCENLTLQSSNQQLKERVKELEKEGQVYHSGATIKEWRV